MSTGMRDDLIGLYMGTLTAEGIADAILAAGYTKPRTVTTASEIENMPAGSVIIGPDWNAEVYAYTDQNLWYAPGSDVPWDERELETHGPCTVLHEPTA